MVYTSISQTDERKIEPDVALNHWTPGRTGVPAKAWQMALKRAFDILIASLALLILAPLLITTAIIIKCDSKGPALFYQKRWGKDCKPINIFKFRSMYTDLGDITGVAQTVAGDHRVTRIGRILRRLNIDELPQLLNVLKGDMSLIGPRCHAIGMLAAGIPYEELVPEYHRRHTMRPGITGLAQMRGLRGPTDRAAKARARVACDLFYISNYSFRLDMMIIIGTIYSELRGGKGF